VELVHADLELRLKAGEAVRVEDYLRRYPELATAPAVVLELVRREYELRGPRDGTLQVEEYARRFPEHGGVLRLCWPSWSRGGALTGDVPGDSSASPAGPAEAPVIPGYEVLGVLGRGGMGVVYQARDTRLDRVVALKMVRGGAHAGEEELARFRTEAEAVARLQHPNIVQVFEVGEVGGLPFFALEYVEGGSLASKLDGTPWPARQAAALVETLARALHAAHCRGIVHRDASPGNVLLAADGTPKWTDFGLAKRLDVNVGTTQTGAILGTPSYLAPEAAAGRSKEVGPAADVYGVGAILYELLTGRPPFRAETVLDTLQQVVADEPVPPVRLNARVPRDLETICLKALAKDPSRRYASAAELAEDLRRFQAGEPINARPVGSAERAWRWCRRNPALAGLLGVVAVTLLLGIGVASSFAVQARDEAGRARANEQTAEKEAEKAQENENRALRERGEVERQLTRAEELLYASQIDRAQAYWRAGNAAAAQDLLDRCRWDYRDWEHHYLHTVCHASHLTLRGHTHWVWSVCFSPDGRRLATASVDRTVKVWDAQTGQEILTLRGHTEGVRSVCFSPDGRRLATASARWTSMDLPGEVKVWDAQTGHELRTLRGHTGEVQSVCFSPDGRRLATASWDRTVRVWDAQTGQEQLTLKGPSIVWGVCFSPDGRRLASADGDNTVKVWDAQTGQKLRTLRGHTEGVQSVCFSPDGRRLATASWDQTVRVWDAQRGQEQLSLKGHTSQINSVCFSPDGRRLASASSDKTVRVWDAQTGQETLTLKGHTNAVLSVCFSPDGRRLASASGDRTVRVWDAQTRQEFHTLPAHTAQVLSVCWSPDGYLLASASHDKAVKVWDAQTGQELRTLAGHTDAVLGVCFSPDGRRLASASQDHTVKVWEAQTGQELVTLRGHTHWVWSVCFSPDGRRLATASVDRTVKVWDAQTGQEILTLRGHTDGVNSVCFSPDGHRLASASDDRTAKVWDARTGQEQLTLKGHTSGVASVCFSPDGRRLASASGDKTVKVWDAQTGQEARTLKGHTDAVTSVCFSPDGRRLASVSGSRWTEPGEVKVWDAPTGQEVLTLEGHTGVVSSVCFSPDGRRLASASVDNTVKMWDALARQEQLSLQGYTGPVHGVGFSADGTRVVAANEQGQVRCWDAHTGEEVVPCTDLPPSGLQALSPDGQRVVRIENGQPVVEPPVLHTGDLFRQRLADPVGTYFWHLGLAREARANADAFALAFHVEPLLLTSFTARGARPRAASPLWAGRPPLTRATAGAAEGPVRLTEAEARGLHDALSRRLDAEPKAWPLWAARGWCRHLLGYLTEAAADLKQAAALQPDEPGLWTVLGTVYLKHHQPEEAETVRRKLTGWPGIDVAVWHSVEADACEQEGDWATAHWHVNYWLAGLPAPCPQLLTRRGRVALELGREKDAARDYAAAVRLGRTDADTLTWSARACLAVGDREGYRQARATMLKHFDPLLDARYAAGVTRTVLLAPAAGADLNPLLIAPANLRADAASQTARGGLLLRLGRIAEAVRELQWASAQRPAGAAPVAELLLAIAQQKQGQAAAARRTLKRTRFLIDAEAPVQQAAGLLSGGTAGPWGAAAAAGQALAAAPPRWDWPTRLEVRILRHEAEEALGERRP
jgi:WD40 repeat protein/tetratricopeptide (TPR) repeat protein